MLNKKSESFYCFGETVVHGNDSKDTWEIMGAVISLSANDFSHDNSDMFRKAYKTTFVYFSQIYIS